jgi:hypothetical protein
VIPALPELRGQLALLASWPAGAERRYRCTALPEQKVIPARPVHWVLLARQTTRKGRRRNERARLTTFALLFLWALAATRCPRQPGTQAGHVIKIVIVKP